MTETKELDNEPIIIGKPGRPTPYERLRKRFHAAVKNVYPDSKQTSDEEEFIAGDDGVIFIGAGIPEKDTGPLRPYMKPSGATIPVQPPEPDPNQKYRDANAEAEARSKQKTTDGVANRKKKDKILRRRGG